MAAAGAYVAEALIASELTAGAKSGLFGGSGSRGDFLFCIPIQVGPASPYCRNVRHWMHAILFAQVAMCILRVAWLSDIPGGLWMAALCALGWYAYSQDMNITYICLWGAGCILNGIFDTIGLVVGVILKVLTLQFLEILLHALVPVSELLGGAYAWHLYLDYYKSGGGNGDGLGRMAKFSQSMPDPMGKLVEGSDPHEYRSLMKGLQRQGKDVQQALDAKAMETQFHKGSNAVATGMTGASQWIQQGLPVGGGVGAAGQGPGGGTPGGTGYGGRLQQKAPCC